MSSSQVPVGFIRLSLALGGNPPKVSRKDSRNWGFLKAKSKIRYDGFEGANSRMESQA